MKDAFIKASRYRPIEFWVITAIFAVVVFINVYESLTYDHPPYAGATFYQYFIEAKVPFNFFRHHFVPHLVRHFIIIGAVLSLNFIVFPGLAKKSKRIKAIILLAVVFCLTLLGFYLTGLRVFAYRLAPGYTPDIKRGIFFNSLEYSWSIFWLIIIYIFIKYLSFYLVGLSEKLESRYKYLRKEAVIAAGVWLAGILQLRFVRADTEILLGWTIVWPTGISLYLYSFNKLIPEALAQAGHQFWHYIKRCAVLLMALAFITYLFSLLFTQRDNAGAGYALFNSLFQLFITVPLTWFLYRWFQKRDDRLSLLEKKLQRSSADYDLLKSQINPHFLFNALNTLYGTAMQENAERTSEGVQKLGDMMRFMLKENVQDYIPVSKEIEYLNNYISLQKLRISKAANIHIEINIEEPEHEYRIVPMLLIPFVENAFKHGISLRQPSYIRVSLRIIQSTLYFETENSKHAHTGSDPEKNSNGIGLANVKQRLNLMYWNKHELSITENSSKFSASLKVELL